MHRKTQRGKELDRKIGGKREVTSKLEGKCGSYNKRVEMTTKFCILRFLEIKVEKKRRVLKKEMTRIVCFGET